MSPNKEVCKKLNLVWGLNAVLVDDFNDSEDMLKEIVEKFGLPDKSKAIRCLLDYVAEDGEWEEIFDTVRCNHC